MSEKNEVEKLADALEEYVRRMSGGVTFVEAERVANGCGVEWAGDRCICSTKDENIVLWLGMSETAVAAVHSLIRSGRLEYKATTPIVYMIDGGMPNMAVLKRVPSKPLKTERWLPVVFNLPRGGK